VLAFDPATRKIKFLNTGSFVRQHDPDFIDGNTISVFDNNNIASRFYGHQSRILILSAITNQSHVFYSGNKEQRFYTRVMGKHQWLPNGNVLISETLKGRAFEVDKRGEIVWQYFNEVEEGMIGIMSEVQRLPSEYKELFDQKTLSGKCKMSSSIQRS
jgi:hypothetical protein